VSSSRAAITAIFFLNGVVFSSWYARLPAIQDDLGIGPGALGLALLGAPLGLLIAQPLVGGVVARRGSRPLVAAAPLYTSTVVLPALAIDTATLFVAVLAVGAANGTLDISMNAQGIAVERAEGRRIFSSLHAAFSFGALSGALLAGLAAAAGIEPLVHLALCAAVAGVAAFLAARHLLPAAADARPQSHRVARPSRRLTALGVIAFCALLAEGAVFDWSAIYVAGEAGASLGLAPAGLAAFSLAMGLGRLAGDPLSGRHGAPRIARGSGALAACGLALALLIATPVGAVAGFALMGLGLSTLFPLSLRAAGDDPERAGPALAAVSTVGYTGFLAGPPAIGLLAEATDLRTALAPICLLLLLAASLAGHLRVSAPAPAKA
jgi:predicted MFS family arabinose efflux permease